jgi:hypothetical protein
MLYLATSWYPSYKELYIYFDLLADEIFSLLQYKIVNTLSPVIMSGNETSTGYEV